MRQVLRYAWASVWAVRAWRVFVAAGVLIALGGTCLAVGANADSKEVIHSCHSSGINCLVGTTSSAATAPDPNALSVIYKADHGVVQPDMTGGFVERCPATAPHAISGYFGPDDDAAYGQLTLAASAPFGHRDRQWVVAVEDLGSEPNAYFVGVVCASVQQPFTYVSNTATVEGGHSGGYTEICPKPAPRPISGFFYPQNAAAGEFELVQSDRVGRGWATVVKNVTDQPQAYVLGAVCAGRDVPVSYLVSNVLNVAPSQANGSIGRCPKRTSHAVGGLFYAPGNEPFGNITLADTFPFGARPRWETDVVNLTGQPQSFVGGTVCIG